MKKCLVFIILIFVFCEIFSQTKFTEIVTVTGFVTAVQQQKLIIPDDHIYTGTTETYNVSSGNNIGMNSDYIQVTATRKKDTTVVNITVERRTIYRTLYEFNLSQIKKNSTNNATVTNVKVIYNTTGFNNTFKITQPNSSSTGYKELWETIGSSTTRQSGVTYSGTMINPASGIQPIIMPKVPGQLFLGVASESESSNSSSAQMGPLTLEITYERNNESRTVVVQSNLHGSIGGRVSFNDQEVASPAQGPFTENQIISYGAVSQDFTSANETYSYIWHQGSINTSKWKKTIGLGLPMDLGSGSTGSYTTTWDELGTIIFEGAMKRKCNLTFTGPGGNVTIGGLAQSFPRTVEVIELNPITVTASVFTRDGISYSFNNKWRPSVGEPVSTQIITDHHETYTASYNISVIGTNATLYQDITVEKGDVINIPTGTTVNLNGNSIVSNGGTLNISGTITGINAILRDDYGNIRGYCGTINSALSYAALYDRVTVSSGSYSLVNNCTIPGGVTLTFESGANVNFNGYYIDAPINTTFEIENGASVVLKQSSRYYGLFTNIQNAINSSTSGQTINLLGSNYNEYLNFTSKNSIYLAGQGRENTTINGSISVVNSAGVIISDIKLTGGLSLSNCNICQLQYSTSLANQAAYIYNGSQNTIIDITAFNLSASFGINGYGGIGYIWGSNLENADCAVYTTNYANYDVERCQFCNNGYDINALQGAYVWAACNQFSSPLPGSIYGNVDVALCPNTVCSLSKQAELASSEENLEANPFIQLDEKLLVLFKKIKLASDSIDSDKSRFNDELEELLKQYKQLLLTNNDGYNRVMLERIHSLHFEKNDRKGFYKFIKETLTSSHLKEQELSLSRYLVWEYVEEKAYDNAIKYIDNIIDDDGIDELLRVELLYEKGIIYKNYLLDLKKAEAAFMEIIDSHSNSPLVMFANYQLGLQNNTEKQFIGSKETEEPEQLTFDCSHYPNPANPTTVIQYTIPEFSDVEINIFNIVGQEILSYSLSAQAPGKHNFMWNAKNLHGELVSSGIYIYKIKVKSLEQNGRNYEKSNKLILLK